MAYASQDDIEDACAGEARLLQIADWDQNGTVAARAISHGQDYADMLIDGHAGVRFKELLDVGGTVTKQIRKLAAAEAVYQIRVAIGQNSESDDKLAAARLLTYQDIRDGKFDPSPIDEAMPDASPDDVSEYIERDANAETWSRTAKW